MKAKAIVHARVHFELGTLYPRFLMTYIHPKFFGREISSDNIKLLDESLSILDHYLSLTKWVATDNMTIADISLVVLITSIEVSPSAIRLFINLLYRWLFKKKTLKKLSGEIGDKNSSKTGFDPARF